MPSSGAADLDAEQVLRRHLPSLFKGKNWNALIAALASGDQQNRQLAEDSFDQLFRSSASGVYLDRLAASEGIERPPDLGMEDARFRQLAIKGNKHVTRQHLLDLLEIFYGTEAVAAYHDTESFEPFELEDGSTLTLGDGATTIEIVFSDDDFENIAAATATEVVATINRECRRLGFGAYAVVHVDPDTQSRHVRLFATARGPGSALTAIGEGF